MTHVLHVNDRLVPLSNPTAWFDVIDPRARDGHVKVFTSAGHREEYVDQETIRLQISRGELILQRSGKPRVSIVAQSGDIELQKKVAFVQDAMRRVRRIQEQRGISFREAYPLAAQAYQREATPLSLSFPSLKTMYRYRKRYLAGQPLLRGDGNKGNRVPRYSPEIDGVICSEAEAHYLVPQSRWSLRKLTDHINHRVRADLLPVSNPHLSTRYIRSTIERELTCDPERARMLPKDVVAGRSIGARRIRAELPFERIEQDALHLPYIVKTPDGTSGNVWLVHAIDVSMGYPVAWYLVVGSPTERDSLACLERCLTEAKAVRFRQLGVDHDLNVYGTPMQLIFDNGPEAKGNRIMNLEKLGVDVKHCKAREAQGKPFIERLNRSLKDALETLQGCTRVNGKDGMRDPVALGDELMTLEELERWIVRWYYEKWVNSPLERLQWDSLLTATVKGDTPAERWKYFAASCTATPLPPSPTEWRAALYDHAEYTLNRKTGITIAGLSYKGDALPYLLGTYGEHSKLHIVYDPDDFRQIWVFEGDERPLIPLQNEYADATTPAWSFSEAKEKLRAHRTCFHPAPQAAKFDHDLREASVAASRASRGRKRGKREQNRETTQRAKESRATQGAIDRPLDTVAPPHPARRAASHSSASPAGPATAPARSDDTVFDDGQQFPVLNRKNGEVLK